MSPSQQLVCNRWYRVSLMVSATICVIVIVKSTVLRRRRTTHCTPSLSHMRRATTERRGIDMLSAILYINLADRKDRKTRLLKNLSNVGVDHSRVHRIDAVRHKMGAVGCAKSHIKTLEQIAAAGYDTALVLEDDFVWKEPPDVVDSVLRTMLSDGSWNVCLLTCNGVCDTMNDYKKRVITCQTASAYIIRIDYVPKLLALWKSKLPDLQSNGITHGGMYAIDQTWKALQSSDEWVATNPFLGKQGASYSDIMGGHVDYGV